MTHFRIIVTSDTVCPWCYIGRRQLQLAQKKWAAASPGNAADTFAVSYEPYLLNPHAPRGPKSSIDKQQYYLDRFGAERTAAAHQRLRAIGEPLGIQFKFGGRTGNSRDTHRLVQLAKRYGDEVEGKTLDGLFATYFEKEGDITDHEVLRGVATAAGIPDAEYQKAIVESDAGGPAVDRLAEEARLGGVSGVPDFKIQDQYGISGGREPEAFLSIFQRIKNAE